MELLGDFKTSVKRALEEIDPEWESYEGLVVCGSHAPDLLEVDNLLSRINYARNMEIPYLGICFGHQLAAIEYARNVLGIKDATSEEFGEGTYVVKKRDHLNVGLKDGESYWNNYEVHLPRWEKPNHFITVQFHPEYQSSIEHPHPVLVSFLNLCKHYGKNN